MNTSHLTTPDTRSFFQKISWVNTLFLTLTPVVAILGTGFVIYEGLLKWQSLVLFVVMAIVTGLAITGGYHRLFAHKSYQAAWPVRLWYLMFGAAAFQNSALKWSSDHRIHHQKVDTDNDPYSITKGFWYAHILWIFEKPFPARTYDNVPDLDRDFLIRFQDRYIFTLGVLFGFILPLGLGALWGDPWGGLFLAGFARVVMNHHFTFFINSLCHMWGARPYSATDSARDNWVLSLFTYGEGYHNFHHSFPADYRNGIKAYHWDPTKWAIWLLTLVGLTKDLKRVPERNTLVSRLRLQEARLLARWQEKKGAALNEFQMRVVATRVRLEQAHVRFLELKTEYRRLKKQKTDQFHERVQQIRIEMNDARLRLRESSQAWMRLAQLESEMA